MTAVENASSDTSMLSQIKETVHSLSLRLDAKIHEFSAEQSRTEETMADLLAEKDSEIKELSKQLDEALLATADARSLSQQQSECLKLKVANSWSPDAVNRYSVQSNLQGSVDFNQRNSQESIGYEQLGLPTNPPSPAPSSQMNDEKPARRPLTIVQDISVSSPGNRSSEIRTCSAFRPLSEVNAAIFTQPKSESSRSAHAKEGYLTKQGGSTLKTWSSRYMVLQDRNLFYFHDVHESRDSETQPLGVIPLNSLYCIAQCHNTRTLMESVGLRRSFVFKIETVERAWYLSAEKESEMHEWMSVLQSLLRDNQRRVVQGSLDSRKSYPEVILQGWLEKHYKGWVKKRYFVLRNKCLFYYKNPKDRRSHAMIPINNENCLLEIATAHDESEQQSSEKESTSLLFKLDSPTSSTSPNHTRSTESEETKRFALHTSKGVFWMRAKTLTDFEKWVHALLAICQVYEPTRTEAEIVICDVVKTVFEDFRDFDFSTQVSVDYVNCVLDEQQNVFGHGDMVKPVPMTTLSSMRLRHKAVELWQAIRMFCSTSINIAAVDYHVALVQSIFQKCIEEPTLQNEAILQLLKLSINHPDPESDECMQAWRLFYLALGVFLPVRDAYPFVRMCLSCATERFRDTAVSPLVDFCFRIVARVLDEELSRDGTSLIVKSRKYVPSKIEFMSVLEMQNGHHELWVEVESSIGDRVRINFEPYTTASDVLIELCDKLSIDNYQWLASENFSLFFTDPFPASDVHNVHRRDSLLGPGEFLSDLLYQYELALRLVRNKSPETLLADRPTLVLKSRIMFPPTNFLTSAENSMYANSCGDLSPIQSAASSPVFSKPALEQQSNCPISPGKKSVTTGDFREIEIKSLRELHRASVIGGSISTSHLCLKANVVDESLSGNFNKRSCSARFTQALVQPFELESVSFARLRSPNVRRISELDEGSQVTRKSLLAESHFKRIMQVASWPEKLILFNQTHDLIVADRFPLNLAAAVRLAALQAQLKWGDHFPLVESDEEKLHLEEAVHTLLPESYFTRGITIQESPKPSVNSSSRRMFTNSTFSAGKVPKVFRSGSVLNVRTNIVEVRPLPHPPVSRMRSFSVASTRSSFSKLARMSAPDRSVAPSLTDAAMFQQICQQVSAAWSQLRGFTPENCVEAYLVHTLQWSWGVWASYFDVHVGVMVGGKFQKRNADDESVVLAVSCFGIGLLNSSTLTAERFIPYTALISYGCVSDNVVSLLVDISSQINDGHDSSPTEPTITAPLSTVKTHTSANVLVGTEKVVVQLMSHEKWGNRQVAQLITDYIEAFMWSSPELSAR